MKLKVQAPLTDLLSNRIYISRSIKAFSLEDIAKAWEMSPRTLFRYDSVHDREVSRIAARRFTEANRLVDKSICQTCADPLKGHKRCSSCTMLLHGAPECSCGDCIDTQPYFKLIVQLNNEL